MSRSIRVTLAIASGLAAWPALAASPQEAVLEAYAQLAEAADPSFTAFSAERGKTFYLAVHAGGKPDTPSCTTCHTASPASAGQTRAGKVIDPMAASAAPDRYTDPDKVEKWFGRNCASVLGRECTPLEKGDFISFMITQ
jgi:cytochrome c peroxidase